MSCVTSNSPLAGCGLFESNQTVHWLSPEQVDCWNVDGSNIPWVNTLKFIWNTNKMTKKNIVTRMVSCFSIDLNVIYWLKLDLIQQEIFIHFNRSKILWKLIQGRINVFSRVRHYQNLVIKWFKRRREKKGNEIRYRQVNKKTWF